MWLALYAECGQGRVLKVKGGLFGKTIVIGKKVVYLLGSAMWLIGFLFEE